jgi:hypothetical protein
MFKPSSAFSLSTSLSKGETSYDTISIKQLHIRLEALYAGALVPRDGREPSCLWLSFLIPFVLKFPLLYWLVLVIACVFVLVVAIDS